MVTLPYIPDKCQKDKSKLFEFDKLTQFRKKNYFPDSQFLFSLKISHFSVFVNKIEHFLASRTLF